MVEVNQLRKKIILIILRRIKQKTKQMLLKGGGGGGGCDPLVPSPGSASGAVSMLPTFTSLSLLSSLLLSSSSSSSSSSSFCCGPREDVRTASTSKTS